MAVHLLFCWVLIPGFIQNSTLHFCVVSILVFPSCVSLVHPYVSTDTATAWKKFRFVSSDRSDFHKIDNLSIAVHAFVRCMLSSLSADEILLPSYVNLSSNFRGLPLRVEMTPARLKRTHSVLLAFSWSLLLPAPDYAVGIRLGLVYLQEALDHLSV